jgi:hypothetical protein
MEQFRQRVAATCHIGPLDADETQRYIEHRLKRAGSQGKPSFEPAVFDAVYRATRGIPRRINSICDRLLLLGFLSEKTHLVAADVDEVVREFTEEATVPTKASAAADVTASLMAEVMADGDVDLSKIKLSAEAAKGMSRQLDTLVAEQRLDQLQRLERSVLRLERLNVQTLSLLQKLVGAVKKTSDENSR